MLKNVFAYKRSEFDHVRSSTVLVCASMSFLSAEMSGILKTYSEAYIPELEF